MTARPVLGSIVIANYITVKFKLSQDVHNTMYMLLSEEAMLLTVKIL